MSGKYSRGSIDPEDHVPEERECADSCASWEDGGECDCQEEPPSEWPDSWGDEE